MVENLLKHCSLHSSLGTDGITFYNLKHLPCVHHFLATLFMKLLRSRCVPLSWCHARIIKGADPSDSANFRPIALASVVGKLFHNFLPFRLEEFLISNNLIDTSSQKEFLSCDSGCIEHIYTIQSIISKACSLASPLLQSLLWI